MHEYKILTQLSFDWMVVAYFFLGGLSAGSFIFSVFANYWKTQFKPLAKTAAVISPIVLAIGMFILLIDLGQPLRAWRLFLHFNPTSALSWGVWFLNIFFVFSLGYLLFLIMGQDKKAKKCAYLGLPFSLLVASYTALLLNQAPSRVLWHSALLPVLFLVGGLISGLALVMLVSIGKTEEGILSKLGKIIASLLIAEVSLVLVELFNLLNGSAEAVAMAKVLLIGRYSFMFWVVEIILGALIPIYILLKNNATQQRQTLAVSLAIIGILAMRYIVVVGGQYIH